MPSIVAGEPLVDDEAQEESDEGSDGAEGLSPAKAGFRVWTLSITLLALTGAAMWCNFRRAPAARQQLQVAADDDTLLEAWAAPMHGPRWQVDGTPGQGVPHILAAPMRKTNDLNGVIADSTGVKALASRAAAESSQAKGEAEAAKFVSEVAAKYRGFAKSLDAHAGARLKLAKSLETQAQTITAAAKRNISGAQVLNRTAKLQKNTSNMIEHQAEASIRNAKDVMKTAHGTKAVEQMVAKQLDVAKASKEEAASQREAAEDMMNKSAAIVKDAHEDMSMAGALKKEARREMDVAKKVLKKKEDALRLATNASLTAKAMKGDAKVSRKAAEADKAVANESLYSYAKADAEIDRATAEIEEATKEAKIAARDARVAVALNKTALSRSSAAHGVLKALGTQKESVQFMIKEANDMKDAPVIKELAGGELQKVKAGEQAAKTELEHAEALALKADKMKKRADKQAADSKTVTESARKHKEAADAIKSKIDSEVQVSAVHSEEIRAMAARVKEVQQAAAAVRNADSALLATAQAETNQADEEISRAGAMAAGVSKKTHADSTAMSKASHKVVAVAESLKSDMAKVKLPNPRFAEKESKQAMAAAVAREDEMLQQAADRRVCVHLPGVQLKPAGDESEFPRIIGSDPNKTHAECAEKCRKHTGCKQVVYSSSGGCHLSTSSTDQVYEFTEAYNSSFCGAETEKDSLMKMIHTAYDQKPYLPPPVACSWTDEDCSHTQCCNNIKCKWDFSDCGGYTCFKKNASYAGCHYKGPPDEWNGTKLGGPRPQRKLPKAKTPWLVQGTSLFCVSAVMWNKTATNALYDTEAALAGNWKARRLGVTQCDEYMILAGEDAPPSSWGSVSNINAFIDAWDKVRRDGRYKHHDWVVKVDPDTVFFPDRLKKHLDRLRTPRGARVYLKNIDYRFQFMGAMEVLTTQAVDAYYENAGVCSQKLGHEGGEDFYMKTCVDGIGSDHQTDFKLLHDKQNAQHGCNDGWTAAFHSYKSVNDWNACYSQAVAAR